MFQVDNAIPHRWHVVDDYVHVNNINRMYWPANSPGLEVIKLEFILKLKIKRNDWCLRTRVRKQSIIALFLSLRMYLEARSQLYRELVEWAGLQVLSLSLITEGIFSHAWTCYNGIITISETNRVPSLRLKMMSLQVWGVYITRKGLCLCCFRVFWM